MAFKKLIPGSSLFYYGVIRRVVCNKPGAQEGVGHYVDVDLWVKDSTPLPIDPLSPNQPMPDRLEQSTTYHLPASEMDIVAQGPAGVNTFTLAYGWVKTNIQLYSDFIDC